jgi:predicted nucleic acid-binding protein
MFVDTSAFYALADQSDRNHDLARNYYESIIEMKQLFTTDYVLIECWFLLASRLGRDKALSFWDGIQSGIISLVFIQKTDIDRARKIIEDFADQDFSIVDAANFALMERLNQREAFAFDNHFRVYRFGERKNRRLAVFPQR